MSEVQNFFRCGSLFVAEFDLGFELKAFFVAVPFTLQKIDFKESLPCRIYKQRLLLK